MNIWHNGDFVTYAGRTYKVLRVRHHNSMFNSKGYNYVTLEGSGVQIDVIIGPDEAARFSPDFRSGSD